MVKYYCKSCDNILTEMDRIFHSRFHYLKEIKDFNPPEIEEDPKFHLIVRNKYNDNKIEFEFPISTKTKAKKKKEEIIKEYNWHDGFTYEIKKITNKSEKP